MNKDNVSQETIAAQATPPGRGGVAIVRVSGYLVTQMIPAILKKEISPRQAHYLPFYDHDDTVLDEGIALFFQNPHSFTGEDVLELHGHGGPIVVDQLLQRIVSLGGRIARPGEFSERAFLNGKIDLAQAEAISDLINATSHQAARSAMRSLQGAFSNEIHAICEDMIHLRMYIEAAIDFTDEEIDFLADDTITSSMRTIMEKLITIQHKAKQGSFLREGITVVITGEPNVGKSSLLNALSGKETAIVTEIPGTTRDVIRDFILIDGMPVHITDTAGLRESEDIVEQEGIRRAHHEIKHADLILHVCNANQEFSPYTEALTQSIIEVRNKIDLTHESPSKKMLNNCPVISLSARSGEGVQLLRDTIKSLVGFHLEDEGVFLARRRHLDALHRAEQCIQESLKQLSTSKNGELAAEDLRQAHLALCEITGEFTTDDLLGRIFSSFCIGK